MNTSTWLAKEIQRKKGITVDLKFHYNRALIIKTYGTVTEQKQNPMETIKEHRDMSNIYGH